VTAATCPAGGNACQVAACVGGTCGFAAGPALVLPAGSQTAGDCQKLTCDGTSQTPVSVADNTDLPADDGNACTSDTCVAGAPAHPPTASGTSCSVGGTVCDGAGACVQCVSAATCPAGASACQIATCTGGACGFGAAPAATPVGSQTAGDCQKLICDGASQTPVSVADNADVPADDLNQCTTEVCTAGVPSHPNAAAGTPCTQMSGTACDGAGVCVGAPTVTGTTPADGGTAAATTTVTVAFSAAMNPATLTGQTALGACSGSIQVSVNDFASCVGFSAAAPVMNGSNTTATFTAQPGLLINRTYKIRVTTAAQSAIAVALGAQYTAATGFGTTNPMPSAATGVVLSQVYGGGGNTSAVYKNDFIELHNRGTTAVSLTGWSVQYASAAGTTWQVTNLSGSIPAGGYYLVAEASGGAVGATLPTANATGGINMSATAGKVALVNVTTALSGACPTGAQIVDMIGFGSTASCYEGPTTPPSYAPAPTNATAAQRGLTGCVDTNVNSADVAVATPSPRTSTTAAFWCSQSLNETGATGPGEADYCTTQFPLSLSVQTAMVSPNVYGQIYEMGVTEAAGANATVTAQLGYGPTTANPEYEFGWSWNATTYNVQSGGNDEYQATFTAPAVGTYRYGYRFSFDAGVTWTYCDNNQGDAGAGANGANTLSLAFDLENLGVLTVTP
jgi:hypothetical protein